MTEMIFFQVGEKLRILDADRNQVKLTCVESGGCSSCYVKQLHSKKIHEFCQAVACCSYERPDKKGVVFQAIKGKEEGK